MLASRTHVSARSVRFTHSHDTPPAATTNNAPPYIRSTMYNNQINSLSLSLPRSIRHISISLSYTTRKASYSLLAQQDVIARPALRRHKRRRRETVIRMVLVRIHMHQDTLSEKGGQGGQQEAMQGGQQAAKAKRQWVMSKQPSHQGTPTCEGLSLGTIASACSKYDLLAPQSPATKQSIPSSKIRWNSSTT